MATKTNIALCIFSPVSADYQQIGLANEVMSPDFRIKNFFFFCKAGF